VSRLGEEPVRRILKSIGLTEKEIDIYIFLAKHDTLKGIEISKRTRIDKAEVYRILKSLQSKGFVQSTLEAPARFTTEPFDKVIDIFIKARRDEAALVENAKQNLINDWAKIKKSASEQIIEKFVVIEGDNKIFPRIYQLVKETKNQLSLVLPTRDLLRAAQFGLLDAFQKTSMRLQTSYRLLTEFTNDELGLTKTLFSRLSQSGQNFEGRTPELGLFLFPRMVIRDDDEIILFIAPKREALQRETGQVQTCLWTNCKTLVQSFRTVFLDLWEHSINVENKMLEFKSGKRVPILTIYDNEATIKKYNETLRTAKEEVIMLTSTDGVAQLSKINSALRPLAKRGVSIKVMGPIVDLNISKALAGYCEVRHCQETQLETTLIDGQHLFQFKNPSPTAHTSQVVFSDTAMYTNRLEHVQKVRATLSDIWKKARSPFSTISSSTTNDSTGDLNSILGETELGKNAYGRWLFHVKEKEEGTLTEKDVINKIISAKRVPAKDPTKDINVLYGSYANAVIQPPSHFNLPNMIITAHHENKQSSFGAEDWLSISLWLEISKGPAYIPVALMTDNPKAAEWRKGVYAGTPAGHNSILVRKNKLKVTVQGNTLFAGWTIPILLLPPKYILPPACMLFEGYGELHPNVLKSSLPSGRTQISERNSFKAFVTFFHPASTYQGPGTDGWLHRERIMTAYPPESSKK
jgi:sugar-specific transcriptional regulator TrmB